MKHDTCDDEEAYRLVFEPPDIETYMRLRREAGMNPRSTAGAARGLPGSLFAVQVVHEGESGNETVGMGRVVGDGGCFYQVVDISVQPAHQGRGLGKRIVGEIRAYILREAPDNAFVSLLADGEAHRLYAQFGFKPTAPHAIGMAWYPDRAGHRSAEG
ncbi:MAG: N-acetyltransferase [Salinicola sp.]|uniref:GNAT family N-acetyltransferase n=1 Tax=uncultured Salinicola sp. TaxID=1193542 RepID=UPI000C9881EB|nr:GNAT family N-acetyltransferase [uncultured Salinicola sp.]MAM58116.1 N-acetyltransferase [Salinicola sp.]|tara:strand:- start:687 stop:1160 length:474 start_codon:yes stop_codon:yes gene_type:complete